MTAEDVKYILSGHYQGTAYDPYTSQDTGRRGIYRSIGINRTGVTSICQIRSDVPDAVKGIEWICFGSTTYSAMLPVFTNVDRMPAYLSNVTLDASTENFYWGSRLIGALADPWYGSCVQFIDRYHNAVATEGRRIVLEYTKKVAEGSDPKILTEANEKLAKMAKEETTKTLNNVLREASVHMKNGYNRADN